MPKVLVRGFQFGSMLPFPVDEKFLSKAKVREYEIEMTDEEVKRWKDALHEGICKADISKQFIRVMIIFPDEEVYFVDDFGVAKRNMSSYYLKPHIFLSLYLYFQENLDIKKSSLKHRS